MALLLEAEPGSPWFEDLCAVVRGGDGWLRHYLVGADVLTVLLERGVAFEMLADAMEMPEEDVYAAVSGWQAWSPRQLLEVAACVGVPVGAFVHDERFELRPRVRAFRDWLRLTEFPF